MVLIAEGSVMGGPMIMGVGANLRIKRRFDGRHLRPKACEHGSDDVIGPDE